MLTNHITKVSLKLIVAAHRLDEGRRSTIVKLDPVVSTRNPSSFARLKLALSRTRFSPPFTNLIRNAHADRAGCEELVAVRRLQ